MTAREGWYRQGETMLEGIEPDDDSEILEGNSVAYALNPWS